MSDSSLPSKEKKPKSVPHFWRAIRFLGPHRRLVITSIACAFLVGLTFTGGLSTMLPILRVLMNGETVQVWAGKLVVEHRMGVKLADSPDEVIVDRVIHEGPAARAGVHKHDVLALDARKSPADLLHALATRADPVPIVAQQPTAPARVTTVNLGPAPWYYRAFYSVAALLPDNPVWAIGIVFGFMFSLGLIGNFVRFFQEYFSDKSAILAVNDIRRKLYDHVLHIPLAFFGLKGTSDVTSRLVADAQGLQDGFKTVLGQSIQEPIKASMAFGLALWLDWQLTMFIVIFGPVMFAIIKKFGKKMRRASRRALASSAVMLGQLEASLAGVRVVKAHLAERYERQRYGAIMQTLVNEQLRMSRIDAMSTPILEMLTLLVVGAIVLYASYLVRVKHTLDATTFFGLMACLMAIGESLRRCSKVNNALQKANAAASRIFEILDVPVEGGAGFNPRNLPAPRTLLQPLRNQITFEDVGFTYPGQQAPALAGINLRVPRGQSVAVVGRNGSGKTTLLALLPRFYAPDQGRILIDDIDLSTVTLTSLREQIGIVTQEPILFPGTIAQNIAYAMPNATRDEIVDAAKQAFAHEFIMEKPLGYDTPIEGIGGQLSGGQRQRLCIARAILRQTPILILDEATSQVDAESEHLIQQAIERLMHQRTTFVIAHRFSTILSADTIVVLDRGQIVGQGRHDELLRDCETYRQLYERQVFTPVEV